MRRCEALNAGGTLTDTFTVATVDGTEQVVTDHHLPAPTTQP